MNQDTKSASHLDYRPCGFKFRCIALLDSC